MYNVREQALPTTRAQRRTENSNLRRPSKQNQKTTAPHTRRRTPACAHVRRRQTPQAAALRPRCAGPTLSPPPCTHATHARAGHRAHQRQVELGVPKEADHVRTHARAMMPSVTIVPNHRPAAPRIRRLALHALFTPSSRPLHVVSSTSAASSAGVGENARRGGVLIACTSAACSSEAAICSF